MKKLLFSIINSRGKRSGYFIALLLLMSVIVRAQENKYLFNLPAADLKDTADIAQLIHRALDIRDSREPGKALPVLKKALVISRSRGYIDGIAKISFELGLTYQIMNKKDTALQLYTASLLYMERSEQYYYLVPAVYGNIGYLFFVQGDYSNAIKYYNRAVKAAGKRTNPKVKKYLATALNNMAAIQMHLDHPEVALQYLDQVEQISRTYDLAGELALAVGNKGTVYSRLGRYQEAERYYKSAIRLFSNQTDIKAMSNLASLKTDFAAFKLKQGKPHEAIRLLKEVNNQSYNYLKEKTSITPDYTMGLAYLQLKAYPQAEHYLRKALSESLALNVMDSRPDIYKALSGLYDSTGQYREALYYNRLYGQLKDSLLNEKNVRYINETDAKFRTAEKDRDIVQKQLLITRQQSELVQRNIWIGGISLGALLLALFFINRNRINRQNQKSQARQIHILQQQQELQQQQQEINHLKDIVQGEEKERVRIARELHDGIVSQLMGVRLHFKGALQHAGNDLQNKKDFENTLQYLDEATKELRKTAHNLMPETVLQGGLVQALQGYCEKMATAAGIRIYFQHFGMAMHRDADVELSLFRIIQELLLNAVKHARCTQVVVELNVEDHLISITVEDNGAGIPHGAIEQSTGMGMRSIYTRVKALQGSIDISGRPGKGTAVNIELMVNREP